MSNLFSTLKDDLEEVADKFKGEVVNEATLTRLKTEIERCVAQWYPGVNVGKKFEILVEAGSSRVIDKDDPRRLSVSIRERRRADNI